MTMELIVGTFMFMILLALGYFTIVLGHANLFVKKFPLTVEFEDVMGLRKDDNVVQRGMTFGKVKSLHIEGDKVSVLCLLDSPVRLRKDYRITIVTTSILGGRYMEIKEGSPSADYLADGVTPQGERPYDLMAEAATVVHDIRFALNEGGILTNLESAIASAKDIVGKVNQGEGTLGRLVNDASLYTNINSLAQDARAVAAQLREITDRISKGQGTLGKLIQDDSVYTNVLAITANLRDLSQRLEDGQGTLGKLLSKDDQLYQDLASTAASLKDVTGKIQRGEGLLGKLVNDDTLYKDVKQALGEVRAAVDDFRETSPVVSFTSILFGAF